MSPNGMQDPYKNVDPNGLQTSSTAATALGFGALVASGSGNGDDLASLLGLGANSPEIFTAGFSFQSLGRWDLATVGLALVGLGIVLNVASLILRWNRSRQTYFEHK